VLARDPRLAVQYEYDFRPGASWRRRVPFGRPRRGALASRPAPRVKESPVAFECRHWKTIGLPPAVPGGKAGYSVVFGLVIGIHIDNSVIKNGIVDTAAMRPIARLGYMDYTVVTPETVFTIHRPDVDAAGNVFEPQAAR
jgi:hypothetical protein